MPSNSRKVNSTILRGIALAILMLFGLGVWGYDDLRVIKGLDVQQEKSWTIIEGLFQERIDGMLEIREIIKEEAPYETSIISELAYAKVMFDGAKNRAAKIESYNETELSRMSLPVFMYNIERLNAHPLLGGMIERLEILATRIDYERLNYNQVAQTYITRLLAFPVNIGVRLLKIDPLPLFRLRGEY